MPASREQDVAQQRAGRGQGRRCSHGPDAEINAHQRHGAIAFRDSGEEILSHIAGSYNVSRATIGRL
jgi:hypothetical protein